MTEHNKALARQFFEDVCSGVRPELLNELLTDDYLGNDPLCPGAVLSRDELREALAQYRRAVPDLTFDIEDQVAEDDRVATRWRASGSCLPDGWQVRGISVMRFLAGRQAECWTHLEAPHSLLGSLREFGPA